MNVHIERTGIKVQINSIEAELIFWAAFIFGIAIGLVAGLSIA